MLEPTGSSWTLKPLGILKYLNGWQSAKSKSPTAMPQINATDAISSKLLSCLSNGHNLSAVLTFTSCTSGSSSAACW